MRAFLRPVAARAAQNPIETIVLGFIAATLAYFHVLAAVREATALSPAIPASLRPAHTLLRNGQWATVPESVWDGTRQEQTQKLEMQQVVFSLDRRARRSSKVNDLTFGDESMRDALANATSYIAEDSSYHFFSTADRSATLTLFVPSASTVSSKLTSLSGTSAKFELEGAPTASDLLQHGRWAAYTLRALFYRFSELARAADSLDILLVLGGYILMHYTFFRLIRSCRALKSRFWLVAAVLSSSTLAFVLSLPIALHLGVPVDPVLLTEALPFLVCTVGFDKPLRLARAVFSHEHLYSPIPSTSPAISSGTLTPTGRAPRSSSTVLKPVRDVLLEALDRVGNVLLRDYALEVFVLIVGASSKVGGLREMCALAAIILTLDCAMGVTFYVAVLGVMIEVKRIKHVRNPNQPAQQQLPSSQSVAGSISGSPTLKPTTLKALPSLPSLNSLSKLVGLSGQEVEVQPTVVSPTQVPGVSTPVRPPSAMRRRSSLVGAEERMKERERLRDIEREHQKQDPVARLKLLVIVSFVTLHVLNLCTTLTPGTALARLRNSGALGGAHFDEPSIGGVHKVDIAGPQVTGSLDRLAAVYLSSASSKNSTSFEISKDLLVQVNPPIYVYVARRSKPAPAATATLIPSQHHIESQAWEHFLSAWTSLVGDPVLSKWISLLLVLSITLNAVLMRGIASTVHGGSWGAVGGLVSGVRFSAANLGVVREDSDAEAEAEASSGAERERGMKARIGKDMDMDVRMDRPRALIKERKKPVFGLGNSLQPIKTGLANDRANEVSNTKTYSDELTKPKVSEEPARKPDAFTAIPPARLVRPQPIRPESVLALDLVDRKLEQMSENHQASTSTSTAVNSDDESERVEVRTFEECLDIFENGPRPVSESLKLLNDEEVVLLGQKGKIQAYALEKMLGDFTRAVKIRRALISRSSRTKTLESSEVPMTGYQYDKVFGACCENVVGYMPLPLGIAGPINVDGEAYPVPMATAEGTLVASTSRGCKALNAGGGVTTVITADAMTRGPAIDFPCMRQAAEAKAFIESEEGAEKIREAFEGTSRFAKLRGLKCALAGRTLFVRFATSTGDAMGMNMISKGTEASLKALREQFPDMLVLALSGNYCTDKKPAAINWIEGRGKSVVAEAVVPGKIVQTVLKTTVADLCNLNIKKNLIGSAMAGSIGGFNAHAANILTAIFLATGQDPAQNVESSNCMTLMEPTNDGQDLRMSVTMPSIEVGTVGGGTVLPPQGAVLEMLGMKGANHDAPGRNAQKLARLVAASVMAGELSLLSALAAGHLIRAHMQHNRSTVNTPVVSRPVTPAPINKETGERIAPEKVPVTPRPEEMGIDTPLMPYSGVHTPAPARALRAREIEEGLSRSESDASLPAYSASAPPLSGEDSNATPEAEAAPANLNPPALEETSSKTSETKD